MVIENKFFKETAIVEEEDFDAAEFDDLCEGLDSLEDF